MSDLDPNLQYGDVLFRVSGTPVPQGSKTAFVVGGRAVLVDGKGGGIKRHKSWRAAVSAVAEEVAAEAGGLDWDFPVEVRLHFSIVRPKSRNKLISVISVKPDLDKLIRSVLDAISSAKAKDGTLHLRILKNDSRVCRFGLVEKVYVDSPEEEGVIIHVIPLDHQGNRRQ